MWQVGRGKTALKTVNSLKQNRRERHVVEGIKLQLLFNKLQHELIDSTSVGFSKMYFFSPYGSTALIILKKQNVFWS